MNHPQFAVHASLEETHWWFTARRHIVSALIELLAPPSRGPLIVEIGCGTGGNVAALSTKYSCIGIDRDARAISLARQRFPAAAFIEGVAPQDAGQQLRQASVVLLLDVLEHVEDDRLFLSQVLAPARPGAVTVITVPADKQLWTAHDESFGHFRRYDRERLEATWGGLPVTCLLCSPFNSRLYPWIKWMRRLNRLLGGASGYAGTDFSQPPWVVNWLLHQIFAGEARALARGLATSQPTGFKRGVSLIAVLRRDREPATPGGRGAAAKCGDAPAGPPSDRFLELATTGEMRRSRWRTS